MTRPRAGEPGGFTLVELLIVIAVLGMVMLVMGQTFTFAMRSWERQRAERAAGDGLEPADRMLRTLLTDQPIAQVQGRHASLRFHGLLPHAVPSATRHADIEFRLNDAGQFVLRYRTDDLPPRTPPAEITIVDHVAGLDLAYQNGAVGSPWSETSTGIPALIRFRLSFGADDERHWPDILIAPPIR